MGLFGKASHIPSQRSGVVGFIQDAIHVSSLQGSGGSTRSSGGTASSSGVSATNQRKLDLVDHYDNLAGDALARGDKAAWERYSARAQEVDDSV